MLRLAIFACVVVNVLVGFAKDGKPTSRVSTECQIAHQKFQLNLGDELKETDPEFAEFGYPRIWVTTAKGEFVDAGVPKRNNGFLFLAPTGDSVCKATAAYLLEDGSVALFLRHSNRPFEDRLAAAIYDPFQRQMIATNPDLGVSSNVEKIRSGIAFRVYDPPNDHVPYKVAIRGQTAEVSEKIFEYWNTLGRKGETLISKTDAALTWERSPYRSFFKSQTEFDKAFAWNKGKQAYAARWVYSVSRPNCIRPSKERLPSRNKRVDSDESKWMCSEGQRQ